MIRTLEKNLISSIIFFSICIFSTISCDNENMAEDENETIAWISPVLETTMPPLHTSKTITDGNTGAVEWTDNDELLVFVCETNNIPTTTKEWAECKYKFTTNAIDCKKNIFTPAASANKQLLLDPKKTYNWYVMSPYSENIESPVGNGSFSIRQQINDMSNPTAHLTTTDIMTGVALHMESKEKNAIRLQHLGTLMQFRIYNKSNQEILPKYITFETESPNDIHLGGDFNVDFQKGLTSIQGLNQIKVDLTNAKTLLHEEAFDVFAVMAPFTLQANDKFKIQVVTDKGTNTQISTLRKPITFKAGTINKANVKLTSSPLNTTINPWDVQGEAHEDIFIK